MARLLLVTLVLGLLVGLRGTSQAAMPPGSGQGPAVVIALPYTVCPAPGDTRDDAAMQVTVSGVAAATVNVYGPGEVLLKTIDFPIAGSNPPSFTTTITHDEDQLNWPAGPGIFSYAATMVVNGTTYRDDKALKIIGIGAVAPAEGVAVDDGDANPLTTTYLVAAGPGEDLAVTATPLPEASDDELTAVGWTLTGGTGTGKTSRTISRTTPTSEMLTCTCGTITKTVTVIVTRVTFPATSYTLAAGQQRVTSATVAPAAAAPYISFDTANGAVATVAGDRARLVLTGGALGGRTTLRGVGPGAYACGSADLTVIAVTFTTNPVKLTCGTTATCSATVTPADVPVTFDTDNTTIATVTGSAASLTVTGQAVPGMAALRARWGTETLATTSVYVVGVTFDPDPIMVAHGSAVTVTATVVPVEAAPDVTFLPADTNLAGVTGTAPTLTVTGLDGGETVLRAVLLGDQECGSAALTCVAATFTPLALHVATGHGKSVGVEITPPSAQSLVTFDVVEPAVATVAGNAAALSVTGVTAGATTVRALLNDVPCGTCPVTSIDLTFTPSPVVVATGLSTTCTVTVTPEAALPAISYQIAQTTTATVNAAAAPALTVHGVADGDTTLEALLDGEVCWTTPVTVFTPDIALPGETPADGALLATRNAPVPLTLTVPADLTEGTVTLTAVNGQRLRLWADAEKTTEILLPNASWTIGQDAVPATVYVEGIQASDAMRDTALTCSFTNPSGSATDTVQITVVHIDVEMQGLGEGVEELPGALLWHNRDDDNANTTADNAETGTVANENDLVAITLSVQPAALHIGTLALSVGGNTRLWTTATKGTQQTVLSWDLAQATPPTTLYLEGLALSAALGDQAITWSYTHDDLEATDLVKATVVDADLIIPGVTEAQETTVGGFVGIHKAPLPLTLNLPAGVALGTVTLEAVSGGQRITLWADAAKTTPLALPASWDVSQVPLPSTVYVDGESVSQAVRDVEVKLSYTRGADTYEDTLKLTVLALNIQLQNLPEETEAQPHEELPGAFLWLNRDDDNANTTPDKDETGPVTDENELVAATLSLQPALTEGTVTLSIGARGAGWTTATKGTAAATSWNLATDTLAGTVYIEGITRSEVLGDCEITLTYAQLTEVADLVKATVVDPDLRIEDVAEADEDTIGGFVGTGKALLPVHLGIPTGLTVGTVTLEAVAGGTKIRVWADAEKTTQINLPATWDISLPGVTAPATVYLEGIETSAAVRDITLKLSYAHEGTTAFDQVHLTVIDLNLQVQGLGEETGTPPHEEDPGAFIWRNIDDDNQNATPDMDDPGPVANEDDLVAATLSIQPALTEGTVSLTVGERRRAWTTMTKTAQADASWDLTNQTVPATLYLEGVARSEALGDFAITLTFTRSGPAVSDLVQATVADADLGIDGVTNADEDSIGGFVQLNKGLLPITLGIPTDLTVGTATLSATAGGTRIALWADAEKTQAVTLPLTWDLTQPEVTVPATLYVEGVLTSAAPRDVELSLTYTKEAITVTDTVKLTVVHFNLVVQNLVEEGGDPPHEEDPGAFIPFNGDDDNANGIIDHTETAAVTGENDLVAATLTLEPAGLDAGSVTVTLTDGVKAWLEATRATAVPASWDLAATTVPATIYLEGVVGSSDVGDQLIEFAFTCGEASFTDAVHATVVQVSVAINAGLEADEETVGAFLGLNNNDDDGNGVADKDETADPESGETFVESEKDLLPVTLTAPLPLLTGTLTLQRTNSNIKVWTSAKKVTEITLPRVWNLEDAESDPLPTTLYVEGVAASTTVRDTALTLTYSGEGITQADTANVTVVQVDVALQSAVVLLNRDDDNENEVADGTEVTAVTGENDLVPVVLTVIPSGVDTGTVALTHGGGLKLWTTATKGTAAAASWTLTPEALFAPTTYYVEGVAASRAVHDQELKLVYRDGTRPVHEDRAKATVANLTISMAERVLWQNLDDDNFSATETSDGSDLEELTGGVEGEDDLRPVTMALVPTGVCGTLAVSGQTLLEGGGTGASRLNAWMAAEKGTAPPDDAGEPHRGDVGIAGHRHHRRARRRGAGRQSRAG